MSIPTTSVSGILNPTAGGAVGGEHFGSNVENWRQEALNVILTLEIKAALTASIKAESAGRSVENLAATGDARLLDLPELRSRRWRN